MAPNLARYVNKTIYVSIPVLFEDCVCRPYRLLAADLIGLWLQSEDLARRLTPDDAGHLASMQAIVFVPFAQIAGVLIPTSMPEPEPRKAQPAKSKDDAAQAARAERPKKR